MDKKEKRENLTWTTEMDGAFIEALLSESRQGMRVDGVFTTKAYSNMLDSLRAKFKMPDLKKDHLKNRMKKLKEYSGECYDLFRSGSSGFNWNPETKIWTAEDGLWETLIEANPKAAKWKTKPIANYEALEEVFAKNRATGEGAETAKEKLKKWVDCDKDLNIDDLGCMVNDNEAAFGNFGDSLDLGDLNLTTQTANISSTATTAKRKKRKSVAGSSNLVDDGYNMLLGRAVDALNAGNDKLVQAITSAITSTQARVYSSQEVFNAVAELGFGQPMLTEYYLWLSDHKEKIDVFFGLPIQMRASILERWTRNSS